MKFTIEQAQPREISDSALSQLLNEVYVEDGYCTPEEAITIFDPSTVKQRGHLFSAKHPESDDLAGFVILVPFNSPASKMAKEHECEMHLLGVSKPYRNQGLGDKLIKSTLNHAQDHNFKKMILWTQESMKSAQALYERNGFEYRSNFERNGRTFLLYEKAFQ